jgi:hypothetical protein
MRLRFFPQPLCRLTHGGGDFGIMIKGAKFENFGQLLVRQAWRIASQ